MAKKNVEAVEETVNVNEVAEVKSQETVEEAVVTDEVIVDSEAEVNSESTEEEDTSSDNEAVSEEDVISQDAVKTDEAKKPREGRITTFDKKEAKRFKLDKSGFVKAVLYKYAVFAFRFEGNEYNDDLYETIKNNFVAKLHTLIHTLDIADFSEKDMYCEENSVMDYGIYHMVGVFVPCTARTNVIISAFKQLCDTENATFDKSIPEIYKVVRFMRVKTTAMLQIDASKQMDNNSFAKSFVATSRIGSKDRPKADVRSGLFVNEATNWNSKDVFNMNKYILAGTKVNIFSTDPNSKLHSEYTYRLNFKSRFNIVENEFVSINDDGSFKMIRTVITVSMFLKTMFNKKVPIGIYITTKSSEVDVKDITTMYNVEDENGEKSNLLLTLTMIPPSDIAFETFNNDIRSIKENLFDTFEATTVEE